MRDGEMYTLSVEDGIRLQGFEGVTFTDSPNQVWKLLGNTIPTVLSRMVMYVVLASVNLGKDKLNTQHNCDASVVDDALSFKRIRNGEKITTSYLDTLIKKASLRAMDIAKAAIN